MNNYIEKLKEISFENKYTTWCINIIEKSKKNFPTIKEAKKTLSYFEQHHILPRCLKLGGEKDKNNIVYLSAREHFIVHLLLVKMLKNKNMTHRLGCAIGRMKNKKLQYYNSRTFETAKKLISKYSFMRLDEGKLRISKHIKAFLESDKGKAFMKNKSELQKITFIGHGNHRFGKESSFKGKTHSQTYIEKMKSKIGEKSHRKNKPALVGKYEILYEDGHKEIMYNLREYCDNNKLSYSETFNKINNSIKVNGNIITKIKEPIAVLISPENELFNVFNIKEFCKNNDLYYQCIIHVLGGVKPQHKGWTGYKINR